MTPTPLYWPKSMLIHIQQEACRMDHSLSWCVQFAWKTARGELTKLEPLASHPGAETVYQQRYNDDTTVKQSLYFPEGMLQEIIYESTRQNRSASWLVQRAWCLALNEISALPSVEALE